MRSPALLLTVFALAAGLLAAPPAGTKYATLLAQLQAGRTSIDYTAFRMACAADQNCSEGADPDLREAMFNSLQQSDPTQVLRAAQAVLHSCYADIDGQILAAAAYGRMGQPAKQQFHRAIARGLVNSILHSGNGRSAATGFVVISVNEEYSTLRVLGLRPTKQGYGKAQGHWFDNFEAVSIKTGQPVPTLYFQIDIVHAHEMKAFAHL